MLTWILRGMVLVTLLQNMTLLLEIIECEEYGGTCKVKMYKMELKCDYIRRILDGIVPVYDPVFVDGTEKDLKKK